MLLSVDAVVGPVQRREEDLLEPERVPDHVLAQGPEGSGEGAVARGEGALWVRVGEPVVGEGAGRRVGRGARVGVGIGAGAGGDGAQRGRVRPVGAQRPAKVGYRRFVRLEVLDVPEMIHQ